MHHKNQAPGTQCCKMTAECYNSLVTNFIYEALSLASWTASDPDGTYTAMLCFFRLPFLKESITFSSDADIADETRFYERESIENRLEIIPVNYKSVSKKKTNIVFQIKLQRHLHNVLVPS